MIFSEIYSVYYSTVAKMIEKAIDGASEKEMLDIITENAFGESVLNILPAIKGERWQVISKDMKTPIAHTPTMPLTLLQKQWLKAIFLDPRMKLFGFDDSFLDGVSPLFTPEDYCVYDKYADGDDFEDEEYIRNFRIILKAVHKRLPLRAEVMGKNGKIKYVKFIPVSLEYSEKDDKFRLITSGCRYVTTVNLSRIKSCGFYCGDDIIKPTPIKSQSCELTVEINDLRRAFERCMLHFAHFEKQAEKISDKKYRVKIRYDKSDETELVIRVLSFGPLIEVKEPEEFRRLIKERLIKQKNCGLR